jgi:hypothetical protein
MPVRPRRSRRSRNALTLQAFIDLAIGPNGASEHYLGALEAIYREHRRRFDPEHWCVRYWEHGIDDREPVEVVEPTTDAELPGTEEYLRRAFAEVT